MSGKYWGTVLDYVESILSQKKIACPELVQACERFQRDLHNADYDFRTDDADFVIDVIQETFVHDKGEALDGTPLRGKPFILEAWQIFIVYNLLAFFIAGTSIRRYKEAFIMIPRKNGKTRFIAALAWALALLHIKSGSTVYIVGAALKQALQSFDFILYNIERMGLKKRFRVLNNNQEHSISGELADGSLKVEALAANPDNQDSLNCNFAIADELHAYKKPKQYNIIKEAMKAFTNKLMIGITTAGDDMTSFCYNRMQLCLKILNGTVKDESYFVFICRAQQDQKSGDVDYTNPIQHEMANPNYGVTIRPEDILNDALQAQNDPQQRKDFLSKSLNIYTASLRAYFDLAEFVASDRQYNWTLEQLARLPIDWYGGSDLSKLHDLTAAALYGEYQGVDIAITHAFFPVVAAALKADEDGIPLFGWKDDGWLTMCNSPIVNYDDIVNWYKRMRDMGFRVRQVGHDRKFGAEYIIGMRRAGFKIVDQPQLFYLKSQGFRRIEQKAKAGKFYYLHSDAFEYCLQNVRAIEKTDDAIQYEKIEPTQRIDIFDASVFSAVRMLENMTPKANADQWLNGG